MSGGEVKKRGGWRGVPKPRKNRVYRTFGIDADCFEVLKKQSNQANFVNEAIRHYMKKTGENDAVDASISQADAGQVEELTPEKQRELLGE